MSMFILGVLSGWLAEWLFYNFWWKTRDTEDLVKVDTETKITKEALESTNVIAKNTAETAETAETINHKKDDLRKLLGIGPSMVKRLQEADINSFKQLSEVNMEELKEKLLKNGARINNKGIMDSWNEQAKLASVGDFVTLEALQNKLKKS